MKRVFFCFAALYCAIQFAGCQTNFDQEFENNLIRLSAEHTSGRFHNGDDINFYYHCEFATEVDFAIKAEDDTTLLQQDEATLKPGEGLLTFNINTNGYEGKAFVYITYNTIKPVGKRKSKEVSFVLLPVKGTDVPLTRRPLTDIGLMIKATKRMTAQSASPSSAIKKETSLGQSLCKPGCNLPEGFHYQPTMASGRNERGCISFYR
jgi:hypothetical protein